MPRPPRSAARIVWALGLVGLILAGPVSAHANLVNADPRPNSEVDTAPEKLVLRFSEQLEDRYTRVEVLGPNGTDHAAANRIQEDRLTVHVPLGELPDALYTVRWRTLSATDGHTRGGVYLLGVNTSLSAGDDGGPASPGPVLPSGNGSAGGNGTVAIGDTGGPGEMLARGLGFAGASLALGLPLFQLIARGTEMPREVRRRWSAVAIAGAGVAALASLGLLALLAGRIESSIPIAAGTTPGQNLLLRVVAFGLAGGLMLAGDRGPWPHLTATLTGSGALLAGAGLLVTSLGGHAAAGGVGSGLPIAIDWLHQVAVAFWIGGVTGLTIAGLSPTPEAAGADLVRGFSPLAVASVAVIILTGTLASVDRLTTVADLAESLYGIALSTKILLLLPLIALGAYHRYWLLPKLEEPGHEQRDIRLLRRSAGLELGLMAIVLLAAGVMTTTSPPSATEADGPPFSSFDDALAAQTPGPYTPVLDQSELATLTPQEARNVTLKLLVPERADPLPTGRQPVWLLLYDNPTQTPITDAEVEIQAWMPVHGHGTSPETDPIHREAGMYEGATTWSMPGNWTLRFNVTLPSGDTLRYAPTLGIGDPAVRPAPPPKPVDTLEEDGFTIETFVTPRPVTIGAQNLTVEVTPPEEGFPDRASVIVNVKPPSDPYGEGETLNMTRWEDDAWSHEGPIFVEQGTWRVLVALQGKGTYLQSEFEMDVGGR